MARITRNSTKKKSAGKKLVKKPNELDSLKSKNRNVGKAKVYSLRGLNEEKGRFTDTSNVTEVYRKDLELLTVVDEMTLMQEDDCGTRVKIGEPKTKKRKDCKRRRMPKVACEVFQVGEFKHCSGNSDSFLLQGDFKKFREMELEKLYKKDGVFYSDKRMTKRVSDEVLRDRLVTRQWLSYIWAPHFHLPKDGSKYRVVTNLFTYPRTSHLAFLNGRQSRLTYTTGNIFKVLGYVSVLKLFLSNFRSHSL